MKITFHFNNHSSLDKQKLKAEEKASLAKPQRTQRKALILVLKPIDIDFLCELGVFASLRLCEKKSCRFK
jgi:hypothetical protein